MSTARRCSRPRWRRARRRRPTATNWPRIGRRSREAGTDQRRFRPHHRAAPQGSRAGHSREAPRRRAFLQGSLHGLLFARRRKRFSPTRTAGRTARSIRPTAKSSNWRRRITSSSCKDHQQWLIDYIEANPAFVAPDYRRNEVLGFLKNNTLEDLCITRPAARLNWGIPLPFDPDLRHLRLVRRAGELHQRPRRARRSRRCSPPSPRDSQPSTLNPQL